MMRTFTKRVGLAALMLGCSGAFVAAHAAPDPMFEPILDDIRQQLPDGWQFRLPAAVPSDSALYPFVSEATETQLVVSLGITPDCADPSCTIGMIGVTDPTTIESWPPAGETVTPVDLEGGIQGYYLIQGEGSAANQLVMWQQDGLTYAIVTLADSPSQGEFVEIARSMASEPPIRSDDAPVGPTDAPMSPADEPPNLLDMPSDFPDEPMEPTEDSTSPAEDPMNLPKDPSSLPEDSVSPDGESPSLIEEGR